MTLFTGPGSRAKGVFLGAGIGIGNAWAKCSYDFENEKKADKAKTIAEDIIKKEDNGSA